MTAFNAVRFKVKPGRDQEFLDAQRNVKRDWLGLHRISVVKTLSTSEHWSGKVASLARRNPTQLTLPGGV